MAIVALLVFGGLVSSCSSDPGAKVAVGLLLEDEAVAGVFPDLSARENYSTGENYGKVRPSDLAGGPAEDATEGVVRQWSMDYSRDRDEPVRPAVFNVMSMVVEFPSSEAAQGAAEELLDDVERDGGDPVAHDRFDVAVTPPDDDAYVAAVGVAVVEDRLVTVQVDGIVRIEAADLDLLLDAAARRLP